MWAVFVLGYFFLAVVGQMLFKRLGWFRNSVFEFLASGILCGCALLALSLARYPDTRQVLTVVLCYAFLSEVYLFLFTFVKSSVSASLLKMLQKSAMTADEIHRELGADDMVESRLRTLVEKGFLVNEWPSYRLTAKGEGLNRFFKAIKNFYRHSADL